MGTPSSRRATRSRPSSGAARSCAVVLATNRRLTPLLLVPQLTTSAGTCTRLRDGRGFGEAATVLGANPRAASSARTVRRFTPGGASDLSGTRHPPLRQDRRSACMRALAASGVSGAAGGRRRARPCRCGRCPRLPPRPADGSAGRARSLTESQRLAAHLTRELEGSTALSSISHSTPRTGAPSRRSGPRT